MHETTSFPPCFHRVTIKGLCVRDGKVLLVREGEKLSGKWELPGGGLDFGEDIREGFEREIQEEMGLTVKEMSKGPVYAWPHRYEKKRSLDWYYSLVLAYKVDFEHLDFTPTDECEEIGFFTLEELRELTLAGQTTGLLRYFDPADFS